MNKDDNSRPNKFNEFNLQPNFIPDPGQFNLPEDFIYVENEWGSMFYKHIGMKNKSDAKQSCSNYGDRVHLPIPRFEDENEFYRIHFADQNLWLDISKTGLKQNGYKDAFGHAFIYNVETNSGWVEVERYKWINFTANSLYQAVIMTNEGKWTLMDESESLNSVCVYNIIPNSICSKCPDMSFCRYSSRERDNTQCKCPNTRNGDFCQNDLCSKCKNGGYCKRKDDDSIKCICPKPFYGHHCESSRKLFYCSFSHFISVLGVLVLSTYRSSNKPMILDYFGKIPLLSCNFKN